MRGTSITFAGNGDTYEGYLSVPRGRGPGVIVIQEWWGLVGHIKEVADRFADAGFVALAPDLFHGQKTTDPDEAGSLLMALNIDEAAKVISGAITTLLSHDMVAGEKVGIVGFCMGGQLALYAAGADNRVGACVDFYGVHPNAHPNYAAIQAPVLGLFASRDGYTTPETVRNLDADLSANGVEHEFHTFEADHAFFNDHRPEVYSAECAHKAWDLTVEFLKRNLHG